MTDPRDVREPAYDADPVARFFSEQRAQVTSEPGTDLDWQRIVRGAGAGCGGDVRPATRRLSPRALSSLVLGSAAAVLVAVFGLTVWGQEPFHSGQVRAAGEVSGTSQNGQVAAVPSPQALETSRAQTPTQVPPDITTWSMSYGGTSGLYALGGADCAGETCPVLLRSANNGGSWRQVHSFTGTDSSGASGGSVDLIQPARAITQVRFVSAQVGYVFGGDLWRTADRGASFSEMAHPGDVVLDVEIWNRNIIMLSADGCVQGRCTGPMYVSRFAIDSTTQIGQTVQVPVRGGLTDGSIVVTSTGAYVETVDGDGAHQVRFFDGSHVTDVPSPAVCRATPLSHLQLAASVPHKTVVYALCGERVIGATRSFSLVRSIDSGKTWQLRSAAALQLPNLGQITLAAGREDSVVVAAGGPRLTLGQSATSSTGSLVVSQDGGITFTGVAGAAGAAGLPAGGFDWVASPGGSEFYAISRSGPGYWHSVDLGRTWTVVDPRR